jgi:hypothetical protein
VHWPWRPWPRRAGFMLGGGNGLGSGAVILDDGRTEFWHAGGTTRGHTKKI